MNKFARGSHAQVLLDNSGGRGAVNVGVAGASKQPPVVVYDDEGIDVTPVSLLASVRQVPGKHRPPGDMSDSVQQSVAVRLNDYTRLCLRLLRILTQPNLAARHCTRRAK